MSIWWYGEDGDASRRVALDASRGRLFPRERDGQRATWRTLKPRNFYILTLRSIVYIHIESPQTTPVEICECATCVVSEGGRGRLELASSADVLRRATKTTAHPHPFAPLRPTALLRPPARRPPSQFKVRRIKLRGILNNS